MFDIALEVSRVEANRSVRDAIMELISLKFVYSSSIKISRASLGLTLVVEIRK